jgi:hypothetical protein
MDLEEAESMRKIKRSQVLSTILVSLMATLFVGALAWSPTVHAIDPLVQINMQFIGSTTTNSLAYSSNPFTGDTLVVACAVYNSGTTSAGCSVGDSKGMSWTFINGVSAINAGVSGEYVGVWYAKYTASGADTPTVTATGCGGGGCQYLFIYIAEIVPGYTPDASGTYTCSASPCTMNPQATTSATAQALDIGFDSGGGYSGGTQVGGGYCAWYNTLSPCTTSGASSSNGEFSYSLTGTTAWPWATSGTGSVLALVGVDFVASASTISTTYTQTITTLVTPNPATFSYWFIPLIFILLPGGLFLGLGQLVKITGKYALIMFLIGCDFGALVGVLANTVPIAILVMLTVVIGVLFWRWS